MKNVILNTPYKQGNLSKFAFVVVWSGLVVACGGSGSLSNGAPGNVAPPITTIPPITPPSTPAPTTPPTTTPPVTPIGLITTVKVQNLSERQSTTPITFGQVFSKGDIPSIGSLIGKLSDGSQLSLQMDIKATHDDGSVRHAIISAVFPQLAASTRETISLFKNSAANPTPVAALPTKLLSSGFAASINISVAGQVYSVSADELLRSGTYSHWLAGSIVNEWHVSAPFKNAQGLNHPHLTARFAIRSYTGENKTRVDATVENNWAYEPNPQQFTYDAQIVIGGQNVYSKKALIHYHHARWHKIFWWGEEPKVHIQHNTAYLIASKAIPNYDQSVVITASALASIINKWNSSVTEPMGPGMLQVAMPTAGGRPDIGPLPQWMVMYVLSMDADAKKITLGTGDLAGSWPIHYRDKLTDKPISIAMYPHAGLSWFSSHNIDSKGKNWSFPNCTIQSDCATPPYNYKQDTAHQPSVAYLPYLVTGDYFYLEELQFWATYNMVQTSPYYREFEKGIVKEHQVRGQAWSLRTLGQAAFITPDTHALKQYFNGLVNSNLDFYNTTFTNGNPNQLGVIDGSGKDSFKGIAYTTASGIQTGIAPWMDDFFTWSAGYLVELGFTNAKPLLEWKSKFSIGRMTAPGFCWVDGASYKITVRPNATAPLLASFGQAYLATMRFGDGSAAKPSVPMINSKGINYENLACGSQAQADWRTQYDKDNGINRSPWAAGEMPEYSFSTEGTPSIMQLALAVSADTNSADSRKAWEIFIRRPIKPDYSIGPQFAIVPR